MNRRAPSPVRSAVRVGLPLPGAAARAITTTGSSVARSCRQTGPLHHPAGLHYRFTQSEVPLRFAPVHSNTRTRLPNKPCHASQCCTTADRFVAGFCAVSNVVPLVQNVETEISVHPVEGNGMNAKFGKTVHFVAAEPFSTFLRVGVNDGRQEVAYETAVLGRLRAGFRIFQMRNLLGTRVELACVFVRISFGSEWNVWATPRQVHSPTVI